MSCAVVGDGPLPEHFITVYERADETMGGATHALSPLSEHVDPLTYPLLHVDGTLGYSTALLDTEGIKISTCVFYCHRIMQRCRADAGYVELPLAGGRLFQQYLVDAYVKVETERLQWVYHNQTKLRADSLQGLMDYMEGSGNAEAARAIGTNPMDVDGVGPANTAPATVEPAAKRPRGPNLVDYTGKYSVPCPKTSAATQIGKPIILPATFGGNPRALRQSYLDAMAISSRFGKPDFFVTMTANPKWREIINNLRPGETAADRPDLVARVFHTKLRDLLHDLTKGNVLGRAVAYTWVVEFQKRSLPHAHVLLIVADEDKPRTPGHVDGVVSAELPDPTTQPELYQLVETHMIHGPCGVLNPYCSCMKDGQCTRNYPKWPRDTTSLNVNGYPEYRRRERSPPVPIKEGLLGVCFVVPHNVELLGKYECHLNVEVCTSIKAVKYLYKYTYKGPDMFAFTRISTGICFERAAIQKR